MIPAALLVALCTVADRPAVTFGGHPLRVGDATVAVSADNKQIVTFSGHGILRTFDAVTGREVSQELLDEPLRNFASARRPMLSRNGTTAVLIDATTGEIFASRAAPKREWLSHTERRAIADQAAISGDGLSVAIGFRLDIGINRLRYTREERGEARPLSSVGGVIHALALSNEGDWLLTLAGEVPGGKNLLKPSPIQLLDAATGKPIWTRKESFRHAIITPDDRHLVLSGGLKPQRNIVLDLQDGEPTHGRIVPNFDILGPPGVSHDGTTLFAATADAVVVWDLVAGREKLRLPVKAVESPWMRMAVSADGTFLVTNFDGLRKWDTATGRLLFGPPAAVGHTAAIRSLRFHPNGREVATLAADGTFVRWDVATGQPFERREGLIGNELRFGPKGWRVASLFNEHEWPNGVRFPNKRPGEADLHDGALRLTDPRTGKSVVAMDWSKHFDVPTYRFLQNYLTADGETATSVVANNKVSELHLIRWKPATGEILSREELAKGPILGGWLTNVSPSGRWSVRGWGIRKVSTGGAWLSNLRFPIDRTVIGNTLSHPSHMTEHLLSVSFTSFGGTMSAPFHDGRSGYFCLVLEVASGRPLHEITFDRYLGQLLSPDNRTLVRVRSDRLSFIDLQRGEAAGVEIPLVDFSGPNALAFSADGTLLAVGHSNGSVSVHAIPRREPTRMYSPDDTWNSLAESNPRLGRKMIEPLVLSPKQALELFAKKLPLDPPPKVDILTTIAKLDAPAFAERDAATRTLRNLGRLAKLDLEEALSKTESVEVRQRIEDLLKILAEQKQFALTPETTRIIRVVEVLERIGSPDALTMLEKLTVQTRDERLAEEAAAALARLKLRDVKP